MIAKKKENVAGIELHSKYFPSENYQAITDTSDEGWIDSKLVGAMNGITNFFFFLTKIIAEIVDTCVEKLYSVNVIEKISDMVSKISGVLWRNLEASFGVLFFLIAVIQIFFIFTAKRNSMQAMKRGFMLFCVMGVCLMWFSNTGYYLKTLNHLSSETQGVIMKAGTEFTTSSGEKVEEGKELEGSLAIMRNFYFDLIVKRPYLLMNYGTPNPDKIGEKRIDEMLSYKVTTKEAIEKKKEAVKEEIDSKDNAYMSSAYATYQMAIAFLSFLFSIVLGIPLILIAFMNVIVGILAMVIAVIVPTTAILSYLPSFANSIWNTLGKLIGVFLLKALIGLLILFIFLIVNTMDILLPPTSLGMYFVNILAIAVSIILMLKYRNQLIKFFTAGRVATLDGNYPERIGRGAENLTEHTLRKVRSRLSSEQDQAPILNENDGENTGKREREERETPEKTTDFSNATEMRNTEFDGDKQPNERMAQDGKQEDTTGEQSAVETSSDEDSTIGNRKEEEETKVNSVVPNEESDLSSSEDEEETNRDRADYDTVPPMETNIVELDDYRNVERMPQDAYDADAYSLDKLEKITPPESNAESTRMQEQEERNHHDGESVSSSRMSQMPAQQHSYDESSKPAVQEPVNQETPPFVEDEEQVTKRRWGN
ncbi:hypothetical protein MFLO_04375 [Listeria floridensis FSL S10-1187]|uniref:Conjugative transposon membrane protein n=2 Tax=Listeria floridensis TaxID=1494962 RepID=A0ABN0RGW5_9LIST|nr:hypothetical protein [Listeria floridensis]EUJ33146.1 hypothetical protein MFLO_04375 [Listeria floridensis FSL S10-1187]